MSAGLRTRVRTWSNVLLLVRLWCAVQMTVRFGMSVHRMTTRLETVKVLPVWRQMLNTTPPTEAANVPVCSSAEDERQQSLLPAVVADAACFGALVDLEEHAGDDAGGHDDVSCDLR